MGVATDSGAAAGSPERMEFPPAYSPDSALAASVPTYDGGNYGGGQYGGNGAADGNTSQQTPVVQPVYEQQPVQAQPRAAQLVYQQQQNVQQQYGQQPMNQVIIVNGQNDGCVAITCFILGWFFWFPWFGCYCADGGVCSTSPTAKSFNIASLVLLIISAIGIVLNIVLFVAFSSYFFAAATSSCFSCSCNPAYCYEGPAGALSSSCRNTVLRLSGANSMCSTNCDTCGFGSGATGMYACIGCREGYELDVVYSDCTGECVPKYTAITPLSSSSCTPNSGATCAYNEMKALSS